MVKRPPHIVTRRGAQPLADLLAWEPEPCRSDPAVVALPAEEIEAVAAGQPEFDGNAGLNVDVVTYLGTLGLCVRTWMGVEE